MTADLELSSIRKKLTHMYYLLDSSPDAVFHQGFSADYVKQVLDSCSEPFQSAIPLFVYQPNTVSLPYLTKNLNHISDFAKSLSIKTALNTPINRRLPEAKVAIVAADNLMLLANKINAFHKEAISKSDPPFRFIDRVSHEYIVQNKISKPFHYIHFFIIFRSDLLA
jgi:hypothetical protein